MAKKKGQRGKERKRKFAAIAESQIVRTQRAAAAVQEHLGNKDEAERLRKMAEQKTALAISELKGQAGQMRFLCSGCGADYEKKPEKCEKCNGCSFEKIWRN